ncbi:hypothetical protein Dda_2461 [Drechslerella dactyloides]|uniref:Cell surface protein n=1 Tax=Drechslerella dactyloides TaxID=74499 RepID=A0AAD6IZJ2_DREDA|nr:hypothetical protein Dda_2461 [Drechslerella dactyloides]
MRFSTIAAALALTASLVDGHGLVTKITGANLVVMPGLTVIAGTRRDCQTNQCGSQRDSAIIRDAEIKAGKAATALGRTQGGGPVSAAKAIANFMGGTGNSTTGVNNPAGQTNGKTAGTNLQGRAAAKAPPAKPKAENQANVTDTSPAALMPGVGAANGMPTCSDTGVITMTYHQINGDGAGPLVAKIDAFSGGISPEAFVVAKMIKNVPGTGGNSKNTMTDFDIAVQMPEGMVCGATVAGVSGVCIVRVNNAAAAGPFGGAAAFIQSPRAKKRALEFQRLKKRHYARGVVARNPIGGAEANWE